jgi:Tol biopolymer transport system component
MYMKLFRMLLFVLILILACKVVFAEEYNYKIAFLSERDQIKDKKPDQWHRFPNIPEIYIMDPDGSNQVRLTKNENHEYDYSPIKGLNKIIFTIEDDVYYDIEWMNYDGSELDSLTNDPSNNYDEPKVSHDGKFIIYNSYPAKDKLDYDTLSKSEIWSMDLTTRAKKRLTNNDRVEYEAAISPDDKEIVYLISKIMYTGTYDYQYNGYQYNGINSLLLYRLHYLDLDTGDEGPFYNDDYDYRDPEYSPDNNYIAATVRKTGIDYVTLFTWDSKKLKEFSINKNDCWDDVYKFTSDGKYFISLCSKFMCMDLKNGFDMKQIGDDNYIAGNFDISPDGKTIYFSGHDKRKGVSWIENPENIYSMNIDGTNIKQITIKGGSDPVIMPVAQDVGMSDNGNDNK